MTFKLPTPTGWFELNRDLTAWFLSYRHNPKAETQALYTETQLKQALKDVLEQAARSCECYEPENYRTSLWLNMAADDIRKMIGEIK